MWDQLEMVRVHGTFLTLTGFDDLWERVEDAAWMQQKLECAKRKVRAAAWLRTQHGRLTHRRYLREQRQRNKLRDGVVRCCRICRGMYVVTRQQVIDGTRFCSPRCAARYRYSRNRPKPVRYVTIEGKRRPLPEWAKHFGISVESVYKRMREGMSEVEALTKSKDPGGPKRRREVTINGETRSVSAWARHFGICLHSVYARVHQGMDIATALSAPKTHEMRRPITIDGETRSLSDWAKHFGIAKASIAARMKKGMSDVEALTRPKTPGAGKKPRAKQ